MGVKINTNAFMDPKFKKARGAKKGGGSNSSLMYFDYKKLAADYSIDKLKFVADGEYTLDFLPFPISKKHPHYTAIAEAFGDDIPRDWFMDIFTHKIKTPNYDQTILCPKETFGHSCPICDEYWRIYNGNKDKGMGNKEAYHASKDKLVPLKHTHRNLALVYNRQDGKVYVFDYSNYLFGEKLERKLSRTNGTDAQVNLADPSKDGFSLHFFVDPSQLTDQQGNALPGHCADLEFEKRDSAVPAEVLENLPKLDSYLIQYSSEEIESMLDGTYFLEQDEDDEGDEVETPPANERQSSQPRTSRRRETPAFDSRFEDEEDEPDTKNMATDPNAVSVEDDAEDTREARKRRREARQSSPTCPAGGTFGKDIDEFDECESCPHYDACEQRFDATH